MLSERLALPGGGETVIERWGERGPLVIALHGLASSRRGWARIAERLADRYRIVAFDQRGHGDCTMKGPLTLRQSLDDLAAVVHAAGEPVHALLGHSWGGALVIAGGRELDVARVAAIDPMLFVEPGVWSRGTLAEYRRMFAQTLEEREAAIRSSFAALPEIELEAKLHAARRLSLDTIVAVGEDNQIDAGRWDLRALVAGYPKPLLLALADPKRTVVPADQRAEIAGAAGPHVRIEVFPGASHSLQRDAFDRFIPVLEAFLAAAALPR